MALFSRPHSSSAAVKIVNPKNQDELFRPHSRKDTVQRQCRNIMIYGSCKFQDKGCVYYHPSTHDSLQTIPRSDSPATASLTAQAVNAPVFVPKGVGAGSSTASGSPPPLSTSPSPSFATAEYPQEDANVPYDPYGYPGETNIEGLTNQMQDLNPGYYNPEARQDVYPSEYDHNAMDAFYSAPPPTFVRQPLNYHLYTMTTPASFVVSNTDSHFVLPSSELRELLQTRAETIRTIPPAGLNLPDELQGYHTLVPLESTGSDRRKFGNWYTTVYRAINSSDGVPYVLRRVENFRLAHQAAFSTIEAWSRIRHPSIVSVYEAFTTRSFNDNSLVVAYEYHANAQTLFDLHLKPKQPTFQYSHLTRSHIQVPAHTVIPERVIWSYVVQIASAIRKVHDAGLAVRMIDVTKVLVTGKNRVRISSCGLVDVLMFDAHQDIGLVQQEDLAMFGRLIFALCCSNASAGSTPHLQKSLEVMGRSYSSDVKNVALFLVSKAGPHKNIGQLFDMIGDRIVPELDDALSATDRLEGEMMGELENARLVRLLCKFGFINERPEFAREPRWSETGDRYIIKLFRDYVFHQVDEAGNPVINLTHVLTCLNKLDAGTDERIMLVARDEQNCLVVSYKEIKSCIESAFGELARASSVR